MSFIYLLFFTYVWQKILNEFLFIAYCFFKIFLFGGVGEIKKGNFLIL